MVLLEAINTILVIIGVMLIMIPKIKGLYVMVLAQIGWSIFAFFAEKYFFMGQSLFLLVFNFVGIRNWRKKNIG